ncbi:MAG: hypothetical protein ACYCOR_21695 [Acidobacteriaceae bacterium]
MSADKECQVPYTEQLERKVRELESAISTWSVIEVCVRNPSVASWAREWEERAEKAEKENSALKARVAKLEAQIPVWDTGKPEKAGNYVVVCRSGEVEEMYFVHGSYFTYSEYGGVNQTERVIAFLRNVPDYKP